ncbi:substrate-binding periplasmic protein [Kordiimonas marina]|uniref:substrate-binding periplasmic protein n=1 Tax=Kordiimonas marina TaxID=2872312 RepID=UPI001FF3EA7F|nr:transporter substrate-binding domain-containing protein [Kordiimonas marina]MCJ9430701.1 transporter substrate-binding domain-containing protein [Kordiimonas marina]
MKSFWVGIALLLAAAPVRATDLVVYTEDFPPYNFKAPDGTVVGTSTERVRQVLDRSGLSYSIKMVPWSRAVKRAMTEKNVLIYTLAKTPKRDPKFDWLVPLMRSQYYLFARADDPRPVTLDAVRAGKFRAVCVTANISCEILRKIGLPADKLIQLPNEGFLDLPVVLAGRADVYFNDRAGNAEQLKAAGKAANVVREAMKVDYDGGFYLAAGKQVPQDMRAKVRAAYAALVREHKFTPLDGDAPAKTPCVPTGRGR